MAQLVQYTSEHSTQNHPALSSVPSAPGPELDPKHYHQEKTLPEPPLFSPPPTNTTFDDISFDHHQDLSIASIQSSADLIDRSCQENSASFNEPRTPESIAPSLDYVPFITSQSDSLSVDHVDQPPEIISKAQIPLSSSLEERSEETSLKDHSPASASEESLVLETDSQQHVPIKPEEKQINVTDSSNEEKEINLPPVNSPIDRQQVSIPLPKSESRSKNPGTVQNTASMSVDDWLDISRPELQFAIGLFAVPWSSLVILFRSINMVWTLIFAQPLVQPVAGVILSVIAPSLLYASLVALLIGSAAHIDW